jgi:hypothetical protein
MYSSLTLRCCVAEAGIGIGDAVDDVEALDEPTPLSVAWGLVLLLLVVVWMEMLGRRVLDDLVFDEDTGGRDEDEGVVRSPTTEDPLVDGV